MEKTVLVKGENQPRILEFLFILGLESKYARLLFKVQLESISHHCVGLRMTDAALALSQDRAH